MAITCEHITGMDNAIFIEKLNSNIEYIFKYPLKQNERNMIGGPYEWYLAWYCLLKNNTASMSL